VALSGGGGEVGQVRRPSAGLGSGG
jgi:hypothetical protein